MSHPRRITGTGGPGTDRGGKPAGALASFGLIAFMQPASIGIGIVVMVVSYLWHRYYAGDVTLKGDI